MASWLPHEHILCVTVCFFSCGCCCCCFCKDHRLLWVFSWHVVGFASRVLLCLFILQFLWQFIYNILSLKIDKNCLRVIVGSLMYYQHLVKRIIICLANNHFWVPITILFNSWWRKFLLHSIHNSSVNATKCKDQMCVCEKGVEEVLAFFFLFFFWTKNHINYIVLFNNENFKFTILFIVIPYSMSSFMWPWCSKYEIIFSNCLLEGSGCHHYYHLLSIKKAGFPISVIHGQRLKVESNWI